MCIHTYNMFMDIQVHRIHYLSTELPTYLRTFIPTYLSCYLSIYLSILP